MCSGDNCTADAAFGDLGGGCRDPPSPDLYYTSGFVISYSYVEPLGAPVAQICAFILIFKFVISYLHVEPLGAPVAQI